MSLFRWLHKWWSTPASYHCKPLLTDHVWRAPNDHEKYPVCIKCGKLCWYLRGYTTNAGTRLGPDWDALKLMSPDDPRLSDMPWNSQP